MLSKPSIHYECNLTEPELCFCVAVTNVHMRGFAAFVGIEEGPIRSPAQYCRHLVFYNGKLSCFFAGNSTFLSFSIASARAIRFLVECGMMTSSI